MKTRIAIYGGLGNQMFQYAFLRSLKLKGIDCIGDINMYNSISMHNGFELGDVFDLPDADIDKKNSKVCSYWLRFLHKIKIPRFVYHETPFWYDQKVFVNKYSYLFGCWINESYFSDCAEDIRSIYKFKNIDAKNIEYQKVIHGCNSVSIHIRRGDYLNNPIYNVCDESYYKKSIELIINAIKNPIFFVFSNDPEWCNNFMKKFNVEYKIVDINTGRKSYQDIFLMSHCSHNIIANSTFSWWGAWLNENKSKIVVTPSTWFTDRDVAPICDFMEIIKI